MVDNEGREKENLCHGKGGTKGREISVERDSDQEEGKGKEGGQVGNRGGGKYLSIYMGRDHEGEKYFRR